MGRTNDDQRATVGLGGTAGDAPALDPIRVGDWQVDAALNLLRRGEAVMHLEPKVMELLCYLVARAGQVVTRDELLSALWQGTVVGDDALTQAAIKLRKALLNGGDAEGAEWEAEEIRSLDPAYSTRARLETYPMTDARQVERLASTLSSLAL